MRAALVLLLFGGLGFAQAPQTDRKACVIVHTHQSKHSDNLTPWKGHKDYDYVEGEFPPGMKFRARIGDKQVREIQERGGKVVVLQAIYQLPELEDARKQCKTFQSAAKGWQFAECYNDGC